MEKTNGLVFIPCASRLVVPSFSYTYFMSTIFLTRYVPDIELTGGTEGAIHELLGYGRRRAFVLNFPETETSTIFGVSIFSGGCFAMPGEPDENQAERHETHNIADRPPTLTDHLNKYLLCAYLNRLNEEDRQKERAVRDDVGTGETLPVVDKDGRLRR